MRSSGVRASMTMRPRLPCDLSAFASAALLSTFQWLWCVPMRVSAARLCSRRNCGISGSGSHLRGGGAC